ncbi:FAD-linked oxidase [Streptomyces oceani]|uniref:FAD-linked oxidase n=1 Tax=Streptomyces oceani TaxID=1075402 RepID=A0A1E7JX20_9ACTN|nr:FAD-linked oxidase [Streptomyces oceani]
MEVPSSIEDELATRLRGQLIRPRDPGYEPARKLWNGVVDRHPALLVRCASEEDVVAAVNFSRDHGLPLAVRGGGHGVAGHAVCDGGLVIDLSRMTGVDVAPARRTARAQGGCTLADLDQATQRHGLATPMGVVSATGIAGLTLSGGIGWLRRKYGLSCDNLISARVVTAAGTVLTASESEHADLFWAIRGGGGNFGVVTSFEYRLHPVGPEVYFCFVFHPVDRAEAVLRAGEQYVSEAPEQAGPVAVLGRIPQTADFPPESHGEPFVALLALFPGDPTEGEQALLPLRRVAEPICDFSGVTTYVAAQTVLNDDYPDGWHYYWKSVNVPRLSDELIEQLTSHVATAPSPASTIDVWYQGGAMAAVGERDTAFANRGASYLLGIEGNWEEPSGSDANTAWARNTAADLASFSTGGVYLNFPGFLEEGEQLLRQGYGANYERLTSVKATYDPANLFRLNANITPRN